MRYVVIILLLLLMACTIAILACSWPTLWTTIPAGTRLRRSRNMMTQDELDVFVNELLEGKT